MSVVYVDLVDYLALAAELTGLLAVAAGSWDETDAAGWLRSHLGPSM